MCEYDGSYCAILTALKLKLDPEKRGGAIHQIIALALLPWRRAERLMQDSCSFTQPPYILTVSSARSAVQEV